MRALTLIADRKLELADLPSPPPPAAGEVQVGIKAVALNYLDVWGYRGMAFAKRKMPVVVGVEAAGEIAAVGADTDGFKPGDPVVMYGALTCGTCKACREGRDNLCENVAGIMGFHVDGFARDLVNMPARLDIDQLAGEAVDVESHDALDVLAQVIAPLAAGLAGPAGERAVHDHRIAGLEGGDAGAHRRDLAGRLGADHEWQLALGEGHAAKAPQVEMVQPDRLDADLHLARLRGRRSRDVGELDLAVGNEGQRTHRVSKHSRTGAFSGEIPDAIRDGSRAVMENTTKYRSLRACPQARIQRWMPIAAESPPSTGKTAPVT